jgi:predicted dehydrogenase
VDRDHSCTHLSHDGDIQRSENFLMIKLRVGLVGVGFVGPHHLDAIRRLGFADVTGIATSSIRTARAKADELYVEKAYGDWRALIADSEIDVIDIATPTHLHAPIALAAIRAGKHVIVDKPMALTSRDARLMLAAARRAGVVHAVTFNIRYNAMLQQSRALITRGEVGDVRFVRGHYLQEWLLHDSDYNWRLEPAQGGALAMVSDAGAHWYDLAEHLTGRRITRVLADLATFIPTRRPRAGGVKRVEVPDLGMVLCEFDNGARGQFATSALCAGHKNDLTIEVCGARASLRWEQERPNELWIGHRDTPNQTMLKDPALLDAGVRHYAALPGGHNEAWLDAFRNLMRNILGFIRNRRDPRGADEIAFPTFATGLRVAKIVDAIAASARAGGRWKAVNP